PGPGAAWRAWADHHGALVDQSAGLAPVPGGRVAGVVCPALGARDLLQRVESGHAFDAVPAKPHALDGHARDRRTDPGLCGVGGLPHRGRRSRRCRSAADQFYEDPASGARVVAVLGGSGGLVDHGAGAIGRTPFLAPDCGYGHPQATATVLSASIASTSEQLATVAQKHLPQWTCPILRWGDLCLNPYKALGLGVVAPLLNRNPSHCLPMKFISSK